MSFCWLFIQIQIRIRLSWILNLLGDNTGKTLMNTEPVKNSNGINIFFKQKILMSILFVYYINSILPMAGNYALHYKVLYVIVPLLWYDNDMHQSNMENTVYKLFGEEYRRLAKINTIPYSHKSLIMLNQIALTLANDLLDLSVYTNYSQHKTPLATFVRSRLSY